MRFPYIETSFTLEELQALQKANWVPSEVVTMMDETIETCSPTFNTEHEDGFQYYRSTKSEKMCKVNWYRQEFFDEGPEFFFAQDDLESFFYV